jgi:hypothetical protein
MPNVQNGNPKPEEAQISTTCLIGMDRTAGTYSQIPFCFIPLLLGRENIPDGFTIHDFFPNTKYSPPNVPNSNQNTQALYLALFTAIY